MGTVASITRPQPKAIRHLAQRLPAHEPWFHVSGAQHAASFQLSPPMRLAGNRKLGLAERWISGHVAAAGRTWASSFYPLAGSR
jgi:hypothetical protein